MVEVIVALIDFAKIIRDDPRFGLALLVLLIAGAFVAILIGRVRPDEPIGIRDIRK